MPRVAILLAAGLSFACFADVGADKSKLLVIGNSIVRHPVAQNIGWTNDWGMAAAELPHV